VVSYVVTESGAVAAVKAVRGPAELRAACVAAVQSWRFKPAMLDGQPVAVRRVAQFPFRIKT
jgi:protein TonB